MTKVGIVGAGAAGMMAAISAAKADAQVVLFERTAKLGKKILSTGNGRCNLTNEYISAECFHGAHPGFAMEVLNGFGREETIDVFEQMGICTTTLNGGYVYPRSLQAAAVAKAMIRELERLNVRVICEADGLRIKRRKEGFLIEHGRETYAVERVILACGGQAAPQTGSDGSGYRLAKELGLTVIPPVPALVPLKSSDKCLKDLSGVRVSGRVSLLANGKRVDFASGELQLCDYGLSGLPVFQISGQAARLLMENKTVHLEAELNFAEEFTTEELKHYLDGQIKRRRDVRCGDFLMGFLPEKLGLSLFKRIGVSYDLPAGKLSEKQMKDLIREITAFRVTITGTQGFDRAQVCAGGVDTAQIDPSTMEVKGIPGLHVVGELLDIDGICGGYNLQFAWSTGFLAGKAAAKAGNKR